MGGRLKRYYYFSLVTNGGKHLPSGDSADMMGVQSKNGAEAEAEAERRGRMPNPWNGCGGGGRNRGEAAAEGTAAG